MTTFSDLEWVDHSISEFYPGARKAEISFANGFGASVITGKCFYSNEEFPYELAVLKDGQITYNTFITDDVCGYLTADDVTDLLKKIEAL